MLLYIYRSRHIGKNIRRRCRQKELPISVILRAPPMCMPHAAAFVRKEHASFMTYISYFGGNKGHMPAFSRMPCLFTDTAFIAMPAHTPRQPPRDVITELDKHGTPAGEKIGARKSRAAPVATTKTKPHSRRREESHQLFTTQAATSPINSR